MNNYHDEIYRLIGTADLTNIELAFQLIKSNNIQIDFSDLEELYDWYVNLKKKKKEHELKKKLELLYSLEYLSIEDKTAVTNIPVGISRLNKLKKIKIIVNEIDIIPDELGELCNLEDLSLEFKFDSAIFPACIWGLPKLCSLELDFKGYLTLIPPKELLNSNIKRLTLRDNGLSELPDFIGNIKNLEELDLSNNCFKHLPEYIGNFIKLKKLVLKGNELVSLPSDISRLALLEELFLSNQKIEILPESIGDMQNLRRLYLNNNPLAKLPSSISKLQKLEALTLASTYIEELPFEIEECSKLQTLNLNHTPISVLPQSLLKLKKLDRLFLRGTKLPKASIQTIEDKLSSCRIFL